ncbi:hypothetical protein SSTU70S_04290 [Stutzerimonas stutzeri]
MLFTRLSTSTPVSKLRVADIMSVIIFDLVDIGVVDVAFVVGQRVARLVATLGVGAGGDHVEHLHVGAAEADTAGG